jgi:hypothetical protein
MRLLGAGLQLAFPDIRGRGRGVRPPQRPIELIGRGVQSNRHPDQPYAIWPVQELNFVRLFCVRQPIPKKKASSLQPCVMSVVRGSLPAHSSLFVRLVLRFRAVVGICDGGVQLYRAAGARNGNNPCACVRGHDQETVACERSRDNRNWVYCTSALG